MVSRELHCGGTDQVVVASVLTPHPPRVPGVGVALVIRGPAGPCAQSVLSQDVQ